MALELPLFTECVRDKAAEISHRQINEYLLFGSLPLFLSEDIENCIGYCAHILQLKDGGRSIYLMPPHSPTFITT